MKLKKKQETISLTQLRERLRDIVPEIIAGKAFTVTSYRRPVFEMKPVEAQK